MASSPDGIWGLLGLAGAVGLCCVGTASLVGSATVAGGTAAAMTVASGPVTGVGGVLVSALATLLPLVVIGLVLRWRISDD